LTLERAKQAVHAPEVVAFASVRGAAVRFCSVRKPIPSAPKHPHFRSPSGASERDLAIHEVDRESILLRQVIAALRRIHEGSFGICVECESAISAKRVAAVPWAPRCIECQEAVDENRLDRKDPLTLFKAA
jgi:hypothetical protein